MELRTSRAARRLRLTDLAERRGRNADFRLLSVRLPAQLLKRIDDLARRIGSGKAEAVVALLNEGFARFEHEAAPRRRRG